MRHLKFAVVLLGLALAGYATAADEKDSKPGFNEATFKGLAMRSIGPALMSGRIADIAIHPENRGVWYVAVGSGGVWKTINAGTTWTPVFENENSYSIGCVTIDPNDPDTIWVGSGENVSGRHVGYGDGIYKSVDGGGTWKNMGLESSEHISQIRIDPRDSNVVYVAAQGPLWSGGGERGVYKTSDGGQTWENILSAGKYTGANEVHLDPRDPDTLYAVMWQRLRNVAVLMDGGPETGIHKSTDAGKTWTELTTGLPEEDMGKTGFAISPQDPDVVYATIELKRRTGGFYRSENGGHTWEKQSDYAAGGTGPHYYNEIFASPHKFDRIYHMDVYMHVSDDGGKTFVRTERANKHVDHHAMAFVADDPNYVMVGTDGGLYESFDEGTNWRYVSNLPITQFYKVSVDYDEPFYNVYGGTQDNNTQGGPSRTMNTSGITNADWKVILGGDGHQPFADPTNPDIVYAQWQQGNLTRYDRRTGENIYIQPMPAADEPADRHNWDAPILISPHDSKRLFFASQRVWRSDDRGNSWTALSGDLSRGQDRLTLPIMDRKWSYDAPWDLYAMSKFATVSSLSESSVDENVLYAGTDDGLFHVSEDAGKSWKRYDKLPGVPAYFYVNDIKADLYDADTVYIAVDNHKAGDFKPYLFKSTNRGRSWRSIASNLPDRHLVWRIVQDHVKPDLLFAGTEFGVFFTVNGGSSWTKLKGNTPNIPFRDLVIQKRENDLVGATFGRSFYVLDDYSPLRSVTQDMLANGEVLFPVRKTHWFMPKRPLGCYPDNCKSAQGAGFFVAPNPPFGAVFTYYLADEIRSAKDARLEREKPLKEDGRDTPFPGWDVVLKEALEDEPAIVLTVKDSDGNIVRVIEGPVTAGFHRVAWDLRYPELGPWQPESAPEPYTPPAGLLAAPGKYTVSFAKRVDGEIQDLGQDQEFDVVSLREPTLADIPQTERVAFYNAVKDMERKVEGAVAAIDELVKQTGAIKTTLERSTAGPSLYTIAQDIEKRARQLRDRLETNPERAFMNDPGTVSIGWRLGVAGYGNRTNAAGPTDTMRQSFDIARREFSDVEPALESLIESDFNQLKERLDAAGVPWSPGRGPM